MDIAQAFAGWPTLGVDGIPTAVERIEDSCTGGKCYRLFGGSLLTCTVFRNGRKAKIFFVEVLRDVGRHRMSHYSPHMTGTFGTGTREDAFLADRVAEHAHGRIFSTGYRGGLGPLSGSENWYTCVTEEDTPLVVEALVSLDIGLPGEALRYLELPCGWPRCDMDMDEAISRWRPTERLVDDVKRSHRRELTDEHREARVPAGSAR